MQSHPAEATTAFGHWARFLTARPPRVELRFTRREYLYAFLYGLIFLGTWLRVDYILQFNPLDHIWSDPQRHWEQGTEVLRTDPMTLTDPVFYQIYIGILAKLTLKDPPLVAFYTILLSLFTPWIWYRFLRQLRLSKALALGGWAALSLLPSWIAIYAYFMQETLLLPLLGAALWASWRCRRKQTLRSFLLMALLWALAGLTRGIAIPLAALSCSWLWLEQGDKLRKAGFSALLLALVLGPLAYRSYQQLRILAPHGNSKLVSLYTRSGQKRINIHYSRGGARWNYWFSSPATGEKPLAPLSDWRTARRGDVEVHIDLDRGGEDWQKALAENPLTLSKYLWIVKENLIYLFFSPSWPDNNTDRTLDNINIQMRWLWAPLTLLLLAATAIYWRRLRGQRLLPALLLIWILVQGLLPISVNEGRYRKPAEGLLIAQAVLLLGLAARRRRPTAETAQEMTSETESTTAMPSVHLPSVALITVSGLLLFFAGASAWRSHTLSAQLEENGQIFLSQMRPEHHRQQWGALGTDSTVEHNPIVIGGKRFARGLGVHAHSESRYRIPAGAEYFHSHFGLSDDGGRRGLVEFSLLLDGEEAFSSGPFRHGAAGEILLPLEGADTLSLVVEPLDNINNDHTAWAMARFLKNEPGGRGD